MKYKLKLTSCKQSGLALIHKDNTLHYYENDDEVSNISKNVTPMRLHAISNDSIEMGDWFIVNDKVYKYVLGDNINHKDAKLIAATTDKSLDLFELQPNVIQYYVKKYNDGERDIEFDEMEFLIESIMSDML